MDNKLNPSILLNLLDGLKESELEYKEKVMQIQSNIFPILDVNEIDYEYIFDCVDQECNDNECFEIIIKELKQLIVKNGEDEYNGE